MTAISVMRKCIQKNTIILTDVPIHSKEHNHSDSEMSTFIEKKYSNSNVHSNDHIHPKESF